MVLVTLAATAGSPTWDPFARIGKINGVAQAVGTVPTGLNTGFGLLALALFGGYFLPAPVLG